MQMKIMIETVQKVKEFVNLALGFPCDIYVLSAHYVVDGKSIMGLFSLDLNKPVTMKLDDKDNKYEDLARLYFSKFEVVE